MTSIYVAGKLSGDLDNNKKKMIKYATELIKKGYIVYVPYWTFDIDLCNTHFDKPGEGDDFWADDEKKGYDFWVKWFDFYWLSKCDAIFFLPNWKESKGATLEHDEAARLGMPMFFDLDDVPNKVEND